MRSRLLVVAVAMAACALSAEAQVGIYPVNLDFPTESEERQTIHIQNKTDRPVTLSVYAEDFSQDSLGVHAFSPVGSTSQGCGQRLRFAPSSLTVEPHASAQVDVRLLPAPQSCRAVIWLQDVERRHLQNASVATRVGVKVYAAPSEAAAVGDISGARIVQDSAGLAITARLFNSGTRVMRPHGRVVVSTNGVEGLHEIRIPGFSVLPGHVRHMTWRLEGVDPNLAHSLTLILDYGGERLLGARLTHPGR